MNRWVPYMAAHPEPQPEDFETDSAWREAMRAWADGIKAAGK